MVDFTEGPHSAVVYKPLQPQTAWTIEWTRGETRVSSGSCRFTVPGCETNCLAQRSPRGMTSEPSTSPRSNHQGIEASSRHRIVEVCFFPKDRKGLKGHLRSIKPTRSTISISMAIPSYGNNRIAGNSRSTFMKRNCFTNSHWLLRGTQPAVVILRAIRLIRPIRSFADSYALLGFRSDSGPTTGILSFLWMQKT